MSDLTDATISLRPNDVLAVAHEMLASGSDPLTQCKEAVAPPVKQRTEAD